MTRCRKTLGHGGASFQLYGAKPQTRLAAFAAVALLLTAGCSAAYTGERLFWKAQQLSAPVLQNPSKATPEQFQAARLAYQKVLDRTPGTVWAGRAQAAIGSLYVMQKDSAKAREAFALVLQNYNSQQDLCLNARLAIAKTYELEQHWPEAIQAYKDVTGYHPWTTAGLEAPLYVARLHEQLKDTEEATKEYDRAVRFYAKSLVDAPTPELATQIKGYLAFAYQRMARWDDAVKTLEELATLPKGTNRPRILMTLGAIYQTKLSNLEKATTLYKTLADEFPDNPFGQAAKKQLEQLAQAPGAGSAGATPAAGSAPDGQAPLAPAATNQ